jgi:hypothetical protein
VRDDIGATNPNAAPLATISANSHGLLVNRD